MGNYPAEWFIKRGIRAVTDPEAIDLLRYGIELGMHAGITPELADLSDEKLERVYQNWKKSEGIRAG